MLIGFFCLISAIFSPVRSPAVHPEVSSLNVTSTPGRAPPIANKVFPVLPGSGLHSLFFLFLVWKKKKKSPTPGLSGADFSRVRPLPLFPPTLSTCESAKARNSVFLRRRLRARQRRLSCIKKKKEEEAERLFCAGGFPRTVQQQQRRGPGVCVVEEGAVGRRTERDHRSGPNSARR